MSIGTSLCKIYVHAQNIDVWVAPRLAIGPSTFDPFFFLLFLRSAWVENMRTSREFNDE